ncbi:glutathione S-transferase, partial [Gongronella butleri]
ITLYTDIEKICPYANRVLTTLDELKVPFKRVELPLFNKPACLIGSMTASKLYPEDPIKRAQVNAMIVHATEKIIYSRWLKAVGDESKKAEARDDMEAGFEWLNEQLLAHSETGPYFLGETYSVADIAVAPLVGRALYLLKYTLQGDELAIVKKSARLRNFIDAAMARPSFKASFLNDDEYIAFMTQVFGEKFTKDLPKTTV